MSKNRKTATAELSIELSKISAALSVLDGLLEELGETTNKKAAVRLCAEIKAAQERAFDHLQTITMHASLI